MNHSRDIPVTSPPVCPVRVFPRNLLVNSWPANIDERGEYGFWWPVIPVPKNAGNRTTPSQKMSKEKTQHLGSKTPSKKISKSKKTNLEFCLFFSRIFETTHCPHKFDVWIALPQKKKNWIWPFCAHNHLKLIPKKVQLNKFVVNNVLTMRLDNFGLIRNDGWFPDWKVWGWFPWS